MLTKPLVLPPYFAGASSRRPCVQSSYTHLTRFFSRNHEATGSGSGRDELLLKAKAIMAPFVLRRKKEDVLQDLPPKTVEVQYCTLDGEQKVEYTKILADFKQEREAAQSGAAAATRLAGSKNIVMQLRKLCLHPLLLRIRYTDTDLHEMTAALVKKEERYRDNDPNYIYEDMTVMTDFELNHLCQEFPRALSPFALPAEAIQESIKLKQLRITLEDRKSKGDRVLLFSQFKLMLDVLEVFLKGEGYKYLRIDGSTPVEERQTLIDEYTDNDDIFIFLLTTRAGGVGINLTAANVVIIYDIDYNPQQDRQAEARCHRVGQTRPVHIMKLILRDTVENHMLNMSDNKIKLDDDVSAGELDADTAQMILQKSLALLES